MVKHSRYHNFLVVKILLLFSIFLFFPLLLFVWRKFNVNEMLVIRIQIYCFLSGNAATCFIFVLCCAIWAHGNAQWILWKYIFIYYFSCILLRSIYFTFYFLLLKSRKCRKFVRYIILNPCYAINVKIKSHKNCLIFLY